MEESHRGDGDLPWNTWSNYPLIWQIGHQSWSRRGKQGAKILSLFPGEYVPGELIYAAGATLFACSTVATIV